MGIGINYIVLERFRPFISHFNVAYYCRVHDGFLVIRSSFLKSIKFRWIIHSWVTGWPESFEIGNPGDGFNWHINDIDDFVENWGFAEWTEAIWGNRPINYVWVYMIGVAKAFQLGDRDVIFFITAQSSRDLAVLLNRPHSLKYLHCFA